MSVVVLGAGFAGLGAAYKLHSYELPYKLYEAEGRPGGLARTDQLRRFLFDYSGHYLHVRNTNFQSIIDASGVRLKKVRRRAGIIVDSDIIPYPIQFNLWALKEPLRSRAIADLEFAQTRIHDSFDSFADMLIKTWGTTLWQVFFQPYNCKVWATSLDRLQAAIAGRFFPRLDMALIRAGYHGPVDDYGYNAEFLYPCSGRIDSLIDALSKPMATHIYTSQRIVDIDEKNNTILTHTGQRHAYQYLISTIPLSQLLAILHWPEADSEWLSYTDVINTRIGFTGAIMHSYHWLYVPDVDARFYRLGFPTNVSHKAAPPGTASISIEYARPKGRPRAEVHNVAHEAIAYLEQRRLIDCRQILLTDCVRISPAYVHHRAKDSDFFVKTRAKLARRGIFLAGRYGEWDYYSMEDSFLSGHAVATRILTNEKV